MHHSRAQAWLLLALILPLLACSETEFVEPPPDAAMKPRFRTRVTNVATGMPVTDVRLEELGHDNVAVSNFDGRASVPIDGNIVVIEHTRNDLLRTVVGVTPEVLDAFNGAGQSFSSPMVSEAEFCELFTCEPGERILPMFAYIVRSDMSPATNVEISVVGTHSPPVARQPQKCLAPHLPQPQKCPTSEVPNLRSAWHLICPGQEAVLQEVPGTHWPGTHRPGTHWIGARFAGARFAGA